MTKLDSVAVIWLVTISAVTVIIFGFDKWRSTSAGRRVPESLLVLLGALGGWPAGLVAMNMFRHKTAKWTFQLKYALALIPFIGELWAWSHWR